MEGQEPPIPPTVSPMKDLTTTAAVAMETEGDTVEDKATDSPVDDKTMYDATQENIQQNKVEAASKATETEETNLEKEKNDKTVKEVEASKVAMVKGMAGERRPTQRDDNMDDIDKDGEISPEGIAHSVFGKQSQPTATGQRQKK